MRLALIATTALLPAGLFAAGADTKLPPKPTATTTQCSDGQIWSDAEQACTTPQESRLDDDGLFDAARELAYAGRLDDALRVLALMSDPLSDRVLTYKGFAHRRQGDIARGNAFYRQAIARNPDNLLARSYMGQGLAESGDLVAARAQLLEIRARGGTGSWAEAALYAAIVTGTGYSY